MRKIRHLPYQINPENSRNAYYETLWKEVALGLLEKHECDLSGWSLLDYGSGRGETLMLAKQLGMSVTGADLDPECVRLSSAFGPTQLLDLSDPVGQLGRKAHDVVACFHVLEHVSSPVATLNHLREMARKYILLAVPNGCMMPDLLRPSRNVYDVNEGHLQNWDHSHLLNLAQRHSGLKLVEWGFDHVKIPILSSQIPKLFGAKVAIFFETGLFRRLFPYQCTSVLGLFRVLTDEEIAAADARELDS